jgi:hypothetical protein
VLASQNPQNPQNSCQAPRLWKLLQDVKGDLISARQVELAIGFKLPDDDIILEIPGRTHRVTRAYARNLHNRICSAGTHPLESR